MYNLTRQEVADKLNISTRSVDRYIKAGKLRSEKQGKVVYVHSNDVDNILGGTESKQEVISPNTKPKSEPSNINNTVSESSVSVRQSGALDKVYSDLRQEIKEKDNTIQELSINLGRAQEIAKNSVTLIDFKKSQFLLEESKGHLSKEIERIEEEKIKLSQDLKEEKNTNKILIVFVVLMFFVAGTLFFIKI